VPPLSLVIVCSKRPRLTWFCVYARVRVQICGGQMPWEENKEEVGTQEHTQAMSSKVKKGLKEKLMKRQKQLASAAKH
jgi:hypothetical protein